MIFFVPARKGSERLKNKNTRLLLGRALIDWTFLRLRSLEVTDRVLVSSDDPVILESAKRHGFMAKERPAGLCQPETRMSDVLYHHLL